MQPGTPDPDTEATEAPVVAVTLSMHLDLATILQAKPSGMAAQLGQATVRICEGEPNAALRVLLANVIESVALDRWDSVRFELSAVVSVLADVARSQLEGITP